jgi:hypothetical protein
MYVHIIPDPNDPEAVAEETRQQWLQDTAVTTTTGDAMLWIMGELARAGGVPAGYLRQ